MIKIPKPGITKKELLEKLENFKVEYTKKIDENEIRIEKITDGYSIKPKKKYCL